MTISVIIPTYHEESTLARTLSHTSTLGFDEVIIVDGGSTDRTLPMARAFCARVPQGTWLSAQLGRARQMNEGAKASRADVLLFLHADTELPADARDAIECALADPHMVGGRFDVRLDSPSLWARLIGRLMNFRSRWTGIATGDQAMFVRRCVFDRLGGFADIPLMEDVELSGRLKRMGKTAALRQTVVTSFRRWERHGPFKTIFLMWALRFLYWIGVHPVQLNRWYDVVR